MAQIIVLRGTASETVLKRNVHGRAENVFNITVIFLHILFQLKTHLQLKSDPLQLSTGLLKELFYVKECEALENRALYSQSLQDSNSTEHTGGVRRELTREGGRSMRNSEGWPLSREESESQIVSTAAADWKKHE